MEDVEKHTTNLHLCPFYFQSFVSFVKPYPERKGKREDGCQGCNLSKEISTDRSCRTGEICFFIWKPNSKVKGSGLLLVICELLDEKA